ncbi:MAG: ArsR family transcriptional regulator [Coriobacteriaceae bacterium]|nr:ArsR family transcriptional regulator [Coriobacteriaceae bacterium]
MSIHSTQATDSSGSVDALAITGVMRALSNPNRLRIFLLLRDHLKREGKGAGLRVGEIAERLEVTQSTVSHHLKELEHAKVIRLERRGRNVMCSVVCETLEDVLECLGCNLS